jgi:hypothetical protein
MSLSILGTCLCFDCYPVAILAQASVQVQQSIRVKFAKSFVFLGRPSLTCMLPSGLVHELIKD